MADHLIDITVVERTGALRVIPADALGLGYRTSDLPADCVIISARLRAAAGDPEALDARMADQLAKRDATQPTKDRSAGSTFRNPAGYSSTGQADDTHEKKAWKVIEDAGLRGARLGGAQMSEKHPNFLINTGTATAADLENLGELVRKTVYENSGIQLHWEVIRIGTPAPEIKQD
jgi:UDP-N-acetylmuramate dehydrogenase